MRGPCATNQGQGLTIALHHSMTDSEAAVGQPAPLASGAPPEEFATISLSIPQSEGTQTFQTFGPPS